MLESTKNVPKFPGVRVTFSECGGNAFLVLDVMKAALRLAGASRIDYATFKQEATSKDYDKLIETCKRWVTVE